MKPQLRKKPGRPRAEDQKPMLTAEIVKVYGETGSLEKTGSRCGIAPNTVKAILMRSPSDFAAAKKALATKMLVVSDAATEIAGERLGECSGPQAAVVAGIMAQRAQELLEELPRGQITIEIVREAEEILLAIKAELMRRAVLTPEQAWAEQCRRGESNGLMPMDWPEQWERRRDELCKANEVPAGDDSK